MGGGVAKGVCESVGFAAEGLRIPGLRLLERAEGVPGDPGAGSRRPREAFSEHYGGSWEIFKVSKSRFWRRWNQLA